MQKLLETLTKCQHDLDFLRKGLLEANKIASKDAPVAHMIIKELLAMEAELDAKLNEFLGYIRS